MRNRVLKRFGSGLLLLLMLAITLIESQATPRRFEQTESSPSFVTIALEYIIDVSVVPARKKADSRNTLAQ